MLLYQYCNDFLTKNSDMKIDITINITIEIHFVKSLSDHLL